MFEDTIERVRGSIVKRHSIVVFSEDIADILKIMSRKFNTKVLPVNFKYNSGGKYIESDDFKLSFVCTDEKWMDFANAISKLYKMVIDGKDCEIHIYKK